MSDDWICRIAVEADLPAIVALLADDVLGAARNPPFETMPEAYRSAFASFDADNFTVVAVRGGAIVGCYQLTFTRGLSHAGGLRATIESVRIASALRGGGFGTRLIEDALARAAARGCHLVQLTSDQRRTETRRFYERLGFVASHVGMKRAF
jgi:GNAT superfamily N-acetyltransferase